jgi:hypothetical protein
MGAAKEGQALKPLLTGTGGSLLVAAGTAAECGPGRVAGRKQLAEAVFCRALNENWIVDGGFNDGFDGWLTPAGSSMENAMRLDCDLPAACRAPSWELDAGAIRPGAWCRFQHCTLHAVDA